MNELSKDLTTLEAEITVLKAQTAQNIIEIGRRLNEAKKLVPHGEWELWLEERVDFSQSTATRFMKVAVEFPNLATSQDIGISKAFELLALPTETREAFIAEQPIDDMTVKELRKEIRKRKSLEEQNKKLAQDYSDLMSQAMKPSQRELEEIKLKEQRIKDLEKEAYRKTSEIMSLKEEIRKQQEKLPEYDRSQKLILDSGTFVVKVEKFIRDAGGLIYLAERIKELPAEEQRAFERAVDLIYNWSAQARYNLKGEV